MANASYLKNYRQCQHPVHLPDKAAFSEKRAISTVVSASLTHSSEKKKITLAVWLFRTAHTFNHAFSDIKTISINY